MKIIESNINLVDLYYIEVQIKNNEITNTNVCCHTNAEIEGDHIYHQNIGTITTKELDKIKIVYANKTQPSYFLLKLYTLDLPDIDVYSKEMYNKFLSFMKNGDKNKKH